MSSKYEQKLLHTIKNSTTNAFKTASKRAIQKPAEATRDLIGNKIAEKITKTALKNTCEGLKEFTQIPDATNISRKYTYHQKNNRKLLMNFKYYHYRYRESMEYQKIINLLGNTNN